MELTYSFRSDKEVSQINDAHEAREKAEQLRPYTAFVKDPSSVHCTHTEQLTTTWKSSSKGFDDLFWPPSLQVLTGM